MLQYVFVHGWGNGPEFWQKCLPHFSGRNIHLECLGFLETNKKKIVSPVLLATKKIYVTHSLGTLWALKNKINDIDALITINGFFNFKQFADEKTLKTMKKQLDRDPAAQMNAFWRQCGMRPKNKNLNLPKLQEGLDCLIHQNAEAELRNTDFPVFCLAAQDDPILAFDTMQRQWSGYSLQTVETGGHGLPWSRAEWCSKKIQEFANGLKLEK